MSHSEQELTFHEFKVSAHNCWFFHSAEKPLWSSLGENSSLQKIHASYQLIMYAYCSFVYKFVRQQYFYSSEP